MCHFDLFFQHSDVNRVINHQRWLSFLWEQPNDQNVHFSVVGWVLLALVLLLALSDIRKALSILTSIRAKSCISHFISTLHISIMVQFNGPASQPINRDKIFYLNIYLYYMIWSLTYRRSILILFEAGKNIEIQRA